MEQKRRDTVTFNSDFYYICIAVERKVPIETKYAEKAVSFFT